jgi:hypothetical protein
MHVTSNTLCLQSQLANLFQLFAFFLRLFNESDSGNSKRKIIFLISNSILHCLLSLYKSRKPYNFLIQLQRSEMNPTTKTNLALYFYICFLY